MDQRTQAVASLLCFYAVCAGMNYNQQGPPQHHSSISHLDPSSSTEEPPVVSGTRINTGTKTHPAPDPEAPVMSGTDSSIITTNSSVVLHDYMLHLYQTLSALHHRHTYNSSLSPALQHRHTYNRSLSPANTVTSFVDRGQDQRPCDQGQRYVFDLSSLPTAGQGQEEEEELVEAELRILRNPPPPDAPPDLLPKNLRLRLLLYSCSPAEGSGAAPRQPLASRPVEVGGDGGRGLPKWEVFDVRAALKLFLRSRQQQQQQTLCFHLLAVSEDTKTAAAADPLSLGLGRGGRPTAQRALLVAFFSRRGGGPAAPAAEDPLFREIGRRMQQRNSAAATAARGRGEGSRAQLPLGPRPLTSSPLRLERPLTRNSGRRRRSALGQRSKRSFGGGGGEEAGVGGASAAGGGSGANANADANASGGRGRRSRCGRRPLRVNFKDLGWDDWIIAPLDYEAHHCEGACHFPLRSHLEPTNHAIIQTFMHSMEPPPPPPPRPPQRPQGGAAAAAAVIPASCCVPSRLGPISILYVDAANNVVYKQYEDMVVESCGCR